MPEAPAKPVEAFMLTPLVGNGGTLYGEVDGAVRMELLKVFLLRYRQLLQGVCPEAIQGSHLIQRGQVGYPGGGNVQVQHLLAVSQGRQV